MEVMHETPITAQAQIHAQKAKTDIERKTQYISQNNPLFVKAREGTLSRAEMGHYLANLRFLFSHASSYFERAAKRAQDLGYSQLAEYYLQKLQEELGHEHWADDDLKHYRQDPFKMADVTDATKDVVTFVNGLIDEDPRLLLSHMFFTEYFTVLAAPEFFKNIEEKCGIRRGEVSAISKHEEADRDHAEGNFEAIEKLVLGEKISARIHECINGSADAISRCMSSCVQ